MIELSPAQAIEAVRKNLDEQGLDTSQMYDESRDDSELNALIEKTIPEALDAVILASPQERLEADEFSSAGEGINNSVLTFSTEKPLLRLVAFKASDSDIVLDSFFPESSSLAKMQLNKYTRGRADNPALVQVAGSRTRFKYYTIEGAPTMAPVKIADHLYETSYSIIDYEYAMNYFSELIADVTIGGCTAVRAWSFIGRNLDWLYSNAADFLVKTPASGGRNAVMGIAGGIQGLTEDVADSGRYNDLYRILPFFLQDGINEHGLYCSVNVVPLDNAPTTICHPIGTEEDRICSLMFVRYVLDKFETAFEAVSWIEEHLSLFFPAALQEKGYECHWMISDQDKTYILEVVDDAWVINEDTIITNFYLDGVTFNLDGTVYTPADVPEHHPSENGITLHGSGLERYNKVLAGYSSATTKEGMRALMNSILFTNCYKPEADPFWFSEYVGGDITVDTDPESDDFQQRVINVQEAYYNRNRNNPVTWVSTHSCVYDLTDLSINIVSQEKTSQELNVSFDPSGSGTYIERLEYRTFTRKSESYNVPDSLLANFLYQLTGMVLAVYGEDEKAKYFFNLATSF